MKQNSHEEYRYNSRGQMVEVLSYASQTATTAVDGNFWVTRSYDSQGRLLSALEKRYGTSWNTLSDITTRYNNDGQVSYTKSIESGVSVTQSNNTYDEAGNLKKTENYTVGSDSANTITTYIRYQYWNPGDYKPLRLRSAQVRSGAE